MPNIKLDIPNSHYQWKEQVLERAPIPENLSHLSNKELYGHPTASKILRNTSIKVFGHKDGTTLADAYLKQKTAEVIMDEFRRGFAEELAKIGAFTDYLPTLIGGGVGALGGGAAGYGGARALGAGKKGRIAGAALGALGGGALGAGVGTATQPELVGKLLAKGTIGTGKILGKGIVGGAKLTGKAVAAPFKYMGGVGGGMGQEVGRQLPLPGLGGAVAPVGDVWKNLPKSIYGY